MFVKFTRDLYKDFKKKTNIFFSIIKMSTYNITQANYLACITFSQTNTAIPYTYAVTENLTFDGTNKFYLNTGTNDSDYLLLHPGQTFNAQNFTITFANGSNPPAGLSGFLRAPGTSSNKIKIRNINIVVQNNVFYDINVGSVIVSSLNGGVYESDYVEFDDIIIQDNSSSASNTNLMVYLCLYNTVQSNYLTANNISIYVTGNAVTVGIFYIAVYVSITNYFYINTNTSYNTLNLSNPSFIVSQNAGPGCLYSNIYVALPNLTSSPPNTSSLCLTLISIIGGFNINMSNIYFILGSYSSTPLTNFYICWRGNVNTTLTNYYSNNSSATQFSFNNVSFKAGSSNYQNQYTSWSSPTLGAGFVASSTPNSPYLLNVFQSSPYNSSSYTLFTSQPTFNNGSTPCFTK
jgi:hypothetical protein